MNIIIHPQTAASAQEVINAPTQALLITAPEGAGKEAVANYIASSLLGVSVEHFENSASILRISPDKTGSIGIDAVRQAQHYLMLKSASSSQELIQRVIVIADAHHMTREAQNALLKLLEEPPQGSMLILTATASQDLLPTVVSRVQEFALQKPSAEQIMAAIDKQSPESVQLAMRVSDGWPGLALALLAPDQEHPLAQATQSARTLLQQNTFERLSVVDTLAKQREQCELICQILQQMAKVALPTANGSSFDRWERILKAGYKGQQALQTRVNTKLAMTQLMLSM